VQARKAAVFSDCRRKLPDIPKKCISISLLDQADAGNFTRLLASNFFRAGSGPMTMSRPATSTKGDTHG
jgi:hypothetical protein